MIGISKKAAVWQPTRRDMLCATGAASISWLGSAAAAKANPELKPRSCIFIWLNGGPSQFETFDPKPNASDDVRGPFGAIQTAVPGVWVSELVPNLAKQFHNYAIIRTLAHRNSDHGSTAMLTGIEGGDIPYGAVVTKLLGPAGPMPAYVHIGSSKGDGTQFVSAVDNLNAGSPRLRKRTVASANSIGKWCPTRRLFPG